MLLQRLGRWWARPHGPALLGAVLLNLAVLLVGGVVVVVRHLQREEPQFTAPAALTLPQRPLEHRARISEFMEEVARPALLERLQLDVPTPHGLPPLPDAPDCAVDALPLQDFLAGDAASLLGDAALAGGLSEVQGLASAASFFGIEEKGERFVIIVNTSASVLRRAQRRGVTLARIQEEAAGLVDGLGDGALFGLVQFSQGTRAFADYLAPASAGNRALATSWLRTMQGNPQLAEDAPHAGHEAAFVLALAWEPDVVFLVTDGALDRRTRGPDGWTYPRISYETFARTLRAARPPGARPLRVHVIGFEMSAADAAAMRRLAGEFGGEVREF